MAVPVIKTGPSFESLASVWNEVATRITILSNPSILKTSISIKRIVFLDFIHRLVNQEQKTK
jgi:hypothetical protein